MYTKEGSLEDLSPLIKVPPKNSLVHWEGTLYPQIILINKRKRVSITLTP